GCASGAAVPGGHPRGTPLRAEARAVFDRGVALTDEARYDEAVEQLSQSLALHPDHAETWLHRGRCHDRKKDHDRAIADFSEALRRRPDYALAYHFRGVSRAKQEHWDLAR